MKKLLRHLLLMTLALAMMLPFAWMVLASLKSLTEVEDFNILPRTWMFSNYAQVFKIPRVSFAKYYFHSIFVAAWVTFLTVLTSSMAAYAFARLRWRGRDNV